MLLFQLVLKVLVLSVVLVVAYMLTQYLVSRPRGPGEPLFPSPLLRSLPALVVIAILAVGLLDILPAARDGKADVTPPKPQDRHDSLATQPPSAAVSPRLKSQSSLPGTFLFAASVLLFIPGALAQFSKKRNRRAVGTISLVASAGLFAKSQVTLLNLKVDHVADVSVAVGSSLSFRELVIVGPFAPSTETLSAGEGSDTAMERASIQLDSLITRGQADLVLVLGGVDKRSLGATATRTFGSNEGLAQARANWVAEELRRRSSRLSEITVLTWSAGSHHFGAAVHPTSLADDRTVRVLVGTRRL